MLGSKCLHAGDAGNDLVFERQCSLCDDLLNHAQAAVVESGITPHEESAHLAVSKLVRNERAENLRLVAVPCMDAGFVIGRVGIPHRAWNLDNSIRFLFYEPLTDGPPKIDEVFLLLPLVEEEEHVDLIQRLNGLHRDVIRVPGTDPDKKDLLHANASPI